MVVESLLRDLVDARYGRTTVQRVVAHLATIAVVLACFGTLAASPAQAMTPIDGNCNVNAYYPSLDGSSYRVQGAIYCNSSTTMYLQVCAEVQNGNTWYWITNSCVPADPLGKSFEAFYGTSTPTNPYYGKWEQGVCGHVYASVAAGSDQANYPNHVFDYSRPEQQCG